MSQYPQERKNAIIQKMLSPECPPIAQLARTEGISTWTLYDWRRQAIEGGQPVPKQDKPTDKLSVNAKFAIVVETATLSEAELSQYCRERGLFPEQIKAWKHDFINGATSEQSASKGTTELHKERKRVKELERELRRKEKALAETAALLVLRKKANAIWGKDEDE